jgi:hypothetical protein
VPPEYVLLSTELGGEKRFSSTIARRLGSLGALTKGDRGAADNGDLAKYNFETQEGRAALSLTFRRIMADENVPGLENPRQTLRNIGLLVKNREGGEEIRKEDEYNVPRFLNRVLALKVDEQNALFDYFVDLFDQTVRYAKANGTFDEGVTDIKALSVRLAKPPRIVHADTITGAQTTHYTLSVDLPPQAIGFAEADRVRERKRGAFFVNNKKGNFILAIQSGRHTDAATGKSFQTFAVWRPEGARTNYIHEDDLNEKYRVVSPEHACRWWTERHKSIPAINTIETHIIAGAIIPLWQCLKTHQDAQLRVVRVSTDDGQRIVGIEIPRERVGQVLRSLGLARSLREPEQIFRGILDEGEEIGLVANLKLKRGNIHGEPAIELCGADPYKFAELRELGLINEQINWKQHFFVPTDEEKAIPLLTQLFARYPVVVSEETPEEPEQEVSAETDVEFDSAKSIIELEQWIIQPEQTNNQFEATAEPFNMSEVQVSPKELAYEESQPDESPANELPAELPLFALTEQPHVAPAKRKQQTRKTDSAQLAFDFSAAA